MIRVAHVWRQTDAGGSEATFMRLYAALDHSQVQWDFFVETTGLFIDVAQIEKYGGRVFLIPPIAKQRAYQRVLRTIFQREKYDIVHAHVNELSYYPLKAAKAAGIKVRIAHAHSGTYWRDWMKTMIKKWLRPRVKKVATHWWAVSEQSGRQMFGEAAMQNGQVTVFRNALGLAPFAFNAAEREAARKMLCIGNHQIVVGHVGRMTSQKNHQWLIRVFAEMVQQDPKVVLVLVGEGPYAKRIHQQIARLKLSSRTRFVGVQTAVAPCFQAMDVFVLPSLYEGLPGVAVEAQANGLPCVVADTITPEVVRSSAVERLPLKNVKHWAATALALAKQRGQVTVDADAFKPFDASAQAQHMVELYQNMLGGEGAK